MSRSRRSRALVWTLLYTLLLLVLFISPLNKPHSRAGYLREDPPSSASRALFGNAVNVAVFVPLGWGLHRLIRGRPPTLLLTVTALAGLFSLTVETVQFFLPDRYSSWRDVVANTLGAFLGAWSEARLSRPSAITRKDVPP